MNKVEKMYRSFVVQRSYSYETHDKDGNVISDITERKWREKVVNEIHDIFSNNNMRSIFYVFHGGKLLVEDLHVHVIAIFAEPLSQASAIKIFGASSSRTCEPCRSPSDFIYYMARNFDLVHGWKLDDNGVEVPITFFDYKFTADTIINNDRDL